MVTFELIPIPIFLELMDALVEHLVPRLEAIQKRGISEVTSYRSTSSTPPSDELSEAHQDVHDGVMTDVSRLLAKRRACGTNTL